MGQGEFLFYENVLVKKIIDLGILNMGEGRFSKCTWQKAGAKKIQYCHPSGRYTKYIVFMFPEPASMMISG